MVSYNFHKLFVPAVESCEKRHTIRGHRKRHARPGESVQLFWAMRTRHCRKLLDPDPICQRVALVAIEIAAIEGPRKLGRINSLAVDGIPYSVEEIEDLAMADGFDPKHTYHPDIVPKDIAAGVAAGPYRERAKFAHYQFATYWRDFHGPGLFEGVIIYWEPRHG